MEDCVCVSVTPDRPNIYYEVKKCNVIETDFADLVHLLKEKLVASPRIIEFIVNHSTCVWIYMHTSCTVLDPHHTFQLVLLN